MSELFDSRKQFLDNLVSLLLSDNISIDESLSVSIDAGWGYGKTFFLDRLAEKLESDGHMVVRFNAWETDLSNDAFVSFSDSLFNQLVKYLNDTSTFFEKADLAMIAFGSVLFDKFSSGLPGVGNLKQAIAGTREKYKKLVENEGSFFVKEVGKSGLELVKEKVSESLDEFFFKRKDEYLEKKVVVLVDELDRCRPDYAIQVLERVKHLFKDPRLCFVFAINKSELEKSVKHAYGEIDTSVYFEKFFTFSFSLPQIDVSSFLESEIDSECNEKHKVFFDLLCQMVKDSEHIIGLRQIERIFGYFEAVDSMVFEFESVSPAAYLIPVAIFSKVVDTNFFNTVFRDSKVPKYYYDEKEKSQFKEVIYDKFKYYNNQTKDTSSIFDEMISQGENMHSMTGYYDLGNEGLGISRGRFIVITPFGHKTLHSIYNLVDCLS